MLDAASARATLNAAAIWMAAMVSVADKHKICQVAELRLNHPRRGDCARAVGCTLQRQRYVLLQLQRKDHEVLERAYSNLRHIGKAKLLWPSLVLPNRLVYSYWEGQTAGVGLPESWSRMASQVRRDACGNAKQTACICCYIAAGFQGAPGCSGHTLDSLNTVTRNVPGKQCL